jgi:CBS domain-containing protein
MSKNDSIRSILNQKGRRMFWVTPAASVYEALETMADHDIGAVMVLCDDQLCGMFSERDYARKVILLGKTSKETTVGEIMSPSPVTVRPDQTISECMHLMTHHRVRHLPVVHNGKLEGVLSIGDLVNWTIRLQDEEIQHLNQYIAGSYPS